jgi:hypothetical protein
MLRREGASVVVEPHKVIRPDLLAHTVSALRDIDTFGPTVGSQKETAS